MVFTQLPGRHFFARSTAGIYLTQTRLQAIVYWLHVAFEAVAILYINRVHISHFHLITNLGNTYPLTCSIATSI